MFDLLPKPSIRFPNPLHNKDWFTTNLTDEQKFIIDYVYNYFPTLYYSRPLNTKKHHNASIPGQCGVCVDFVDVSRASSPNLIKAFYSLSKVWPGSVSIGYLGADPHLHLDLKGKKRVGIEHKKGRGSTVYSNQRDFKSHWNLAQAQHGFFVTKDTVKDLVTLPENPLTEFLFSKAWFEKWLSRGLGVWVGYKAYQYTKNKSKRAIKRKIKKITSWGYKK